MLSDLIPLCISYHKVLISNRTQSSRSSRDIVHNPLLHLCRKFGLVPQLVSRRKSVHSVSNIKTNYEEILFQKNSSLLAMFL